MIKGAIFDMDGLMFDTERLSALGWIEAGKVLGVPIDDAFVDSIRGTNMKGSTEIFNKAYKDADYMQVRKVHNEYMEDVIEKEGMPIKQGLFEILNYLKENGVKIALATSTSRESAVRHLERAKVKEYFDALTFGDMVENGKPAPDIFLKAASMLGVDIKECVVFEDSPNGIRAGFSAGAKVIAVPDLDKITDELGKMTYKVVETLDKAIGVIDEID